MASYADISGRYEELVGMHQELFQEAAIQRAERIFGEDEDTAKKVLEELVEAVSWLKPREILPFLESAVCDESFKYQKDKGEILRNRHRQIEDFAFRINTATLLDDTQRVLVPRHILDGKQFDPEDDEFDYYRVCFAQGTAGDLSVYLAGHIFVDPRNDLGPKAEESKLRKFEPNNPYFPQNHKIAVVRASAVIDSRGGGIHRIETRYFGEADGRNFTIPELDDQRNCIVLKESNDKTPLFAVLRVPYTIWTRDQIQACNNEARRYRTERAKNINMVSGYVPQDRDAYVRLYVAERKFEHEILYTLHNFMAQTPSK